MHTSFFVASITIPQRILAHLNQLSYATTIIIYHGTHTSNKHDTFVYQNVNATLPLHITKTFYTHTYSNTNVHHIDQNIIRQATNRTHQTTSCPPIANAILPTCIAEHITHIHIYTCTARYQPMHMYYKL
jgi:hypothetical protein